MKETLKKGDKVIITSNKYKGPVYHAFKIGSQCEIVKSSDHEWLLKQGEDTQWIDPTDFKLKS
jgi:hypothetical protein